MSQLYTPLASMVGPPNQQAGFEKSLDLLTSLCLTYVLCSAVLRSWVRRNLYGIDDTVIAVAIAVCIGHFATNYIALAHGAGKPWHHNQEESNLQLLNSVRGRIRYLLLPQADCSTGYHCRHRRFCDIAVSLEDSRRCLPSPSDQEPKAALALSGHHWHAHRHRSRQFANCYNSATSKIRILLDVLRERLRLQGASELTPLHFGCRRGLTAERKAIRWIAFTAFDICTEAILMILPIYQLWSIQMPFSKKAIVICAFYLRMPVIGLSIARLVYTNRLCRATTDPGLDSALVAIWMQVEVSWAIVSSTFSAVRAFPMNSNSSFGFGFTSQAGPESYNLSRMEKSTPGSSNDSSEARHQIVQNSCERLRIGIEASAKPSQSSPLRLAPSRDQHRIQINTQPCPRLEADERYADNKP